MNSNFLDMDISCENKVLENVIVLVIIYWGC